MPKILVIEDEEDMQFVLSDNLAAEGYEADVTASGRDGLSRALSGQYALVLLDIMLPDINGLDVCKQIRASGSAVPVIMLTARGDEIDKVVGLEVGADDYVTKPFGVRELLARIKAALRRSEVSVAVGPDRLRVGEAVVDFARHSVTRAGNTENLTRYENGPTAPSRLAGIRGGSDSSQGDGGREFCGFLTFRH